MEENELEEYVRMYSNEIYKYFPNLFKYMQYILTSAGYVEDIRYNVEEYIESDYIYDTNIDFNSLISICINILESIDIKLKDKFLLFLNNGTIDMSDEEDTISSTSVVDNHISIIIKRNYNIEDIFGMIHEFFHAIHLEKYNLEFNNDDWYFSTELIAIIGELYTLFYLIENEVCTNDVDKYLRKFTSSVFVHNYVTLENGIFIDLYDKMQSITHKSLDEYIVMNTLPEEYKNVLLDDEDDSADTDEFEYHVSSTYSFAFPLAFLISRRMIIDDNYKLNVLNILENINNYDLNTLFDKFGITEYLTDEESLFNLMNKINEYLSKFFRKEDIKIKSLKELW